MIRIYIILYFSFNASVINCKKYKFINIKITYLFLMSILIEKLIIIDIYIDKWKNIIRNLSINIINQDII